MVTLVIKIDEMTIVWANFALCSNCVGVKPGPILSPFIQMEQGRARPNIRCEGKQISEDRQPKNGQNYHPRRGGAYL